MKDDGATQFEAIFTLFEEKGDNPGLEHIDFEEMNMAIWAALVHKTTGEARKKVNNTGQGSGLYAYIRVWRWFTGQSTTTQAESRAKILHPDQVKKIELLAGVIEDWERRLNLMEERDLAGGEDVAVAKTPDKYKMSALWCMLPDPLRDEVDLKQGEHNGDYSKTRNFVMRFAEAKRKHRGDNMDVSPIQPEQPSGNEHWQQPWNPAWGNDGEEWLDPEVDAMQYGKGSPKEYGKGSYGKGGKGSFGSFSGKASWQQPGKGGKAPWQPPNYNKGFGKGGNPALMVRVVRKVERPTCRGTPKGKPFSLANVIHADCLAIPQADARTLAAPWPIIRIAVNVVLMAMMLKCAQHKLTQWNQKIMAHKWEKIHQMHSAWMSAVVLSILTALKLTTGFRSCQKMMGTAAGQIGEGTTNPLQPHLFHLHPFEQS